MKLPSRSHINLARNTPIINDPSCYTNSIDNSDNNATPRAPSLARKRICPKKNLPEKEFD
jgi:hypothetical protein